MRIFICKNGFSLEEVDDNGTSTEKYLTVEENSMWRLKEDGYQIISNDFHRLDKYDGSWREIPKESLQEDFEEVTNPRKKIELFLKDCGYTYTVEDVIEGYKKSKKYYVSYTMKHCIQELEIEIKTLMSCDTK